MVIEDTHGDPDPYPGPAPIVVARALFEEFGVEETPTAVIVGADGSEIGRGVLTAGGQLGAMANRLPS